MSIAIQLPTPHLITLAFPFFLVMVLFLFGYLAQPRRSLITTSIHLLLTHGRYKGGTGNGTIDVSISTVGVFRRRRATRDRKELRV